ncbi:MAG TPA: NAD(P)H-binding protein [Solirubrobacteraceae bacterium]|jgi:uncharacterized protein YbjT (DUF2867 family)|nr:NAD(P)H-binding protein [Solirubrobacteraceae bacterium]
MRVLVTGASGFVGSLLIPRLCAEGHYVRAFGRDEARIRAALARTAPPSAWSTAQMLRGDALSGAGLREALDEVNIAYYLIHSMEAASSSTPFAERERIAAQNFADAAVEAGVHRIVYLGGLVPRWSPHAGRGTAPVSRHLASRKEVEQILLEAVEHSLALRASIVIGARSRSFRLLVRLLERLPVLAMPAWQRFKTQPIDERDVIEMLLAAARTSFTGRLEIGGPDLLTYGELLTRIADSMLIGRPSVRLRVNLTSIAARVAAAVAGESPELVVPLMEGLQGDLLPADDNAAELLGVRLHSFDSAVEHALAEWEQYERLAAR